MSRPEVVWQPTREQAQGSVLARFAEFAAKRGAPALGPYSALHRWSVSELEVFWRTVWDYFELTERFGDPGPTLPEEQMPGAAWFPEARVNFAEYVLSQGEDGDIAIVGETEHGESGSLTWGELREQTAALAAWLTDQGVRTGDRVVGYLPNIPEAIVGLLGCAAVGAVWASVGQDYGAGAVLERFAQLTPSVLIAADGYVYGGKLRDRREAILAVQEGLPSLTATLLVDHASLGGSLDAANWREVVTEPRGTPLRCERLPFGHPLWVMFTSGTTGLPKGLMHGHGGILLEHLKWLSIHQDMQVGDRYFWFTSPSWVMWNVLAGALATGASVVAYDGSAQYPHADELWRVAGRAGATFVGTSPGYLESNRKVGVLPRDVLGTERIRILSCSGAPLGEVTQRWAASAFPGVPLFSVSGGTDPATAFCGGGVMTEPLRAGEIGSINLGVALDVWDEDGRSVRDEVGEMGIARPMPSMPVAFWNDPDMSRYRGAYFDVYPGKWRHGDWLTITSTGGVIVHGRSDATLNRNGVRMGSGDIYNVVDGFVEIADSLVLGIDESGGDYWMPLFVVPAEGYSLTEELRQRIVARLRHELSPRHVPDEILQIDSLPRTLTGKRLEVPLRRVLQGERPERVVQRTAVDDVEALDLFIQFAHTHREAKRGN